MSKQEEIIEIAGKRVEKRYTPSENEVDRCMKCCLHNSIECDLYLSTYAMRPCEAYHKRGGYAYFVEAEQSQEEEIHSLREWAQILATNPDLRAEFDKMCPPQPIQGSIAPDADVNKWAVTNAFLHCAQAGKIVSEMYGNKFNNPRNRDKYIAFLQQVNLDDRFGELAEILQRYGVMPAPKEQPEADLEAEIERWWNERYAKLKKDYKFDSTSGHYIDNEGIIDLARHFAEWGAEHLKK